MFCARCVVFRNVVSVVVLCLDALLRLLRMSLYCMNVVSVGVLCLGVNVVGVGGDSKWETRIVEA